MKFTTLNNIRDHAPCADGWKKLLKHLNANPGDNRKVAFKTILKSNGVEDAIWCLRTLPYKEQMLFKARVAQSVLHIYEAKYPDDKRPRKAIEYALRHSRNSRAHNADAANAAADAIVLLNYKYRHYSCWETGI